MKPSELVAACRIVFGEGQQITSAFLATIDEKSLKTAFRKRAMSVHPDTLSSMSSNELKHASDRFIQLKESYALLTTYLERRAKGHTFSTASQSPHPNERRRPQPSRADEEARRERERQEFHRRQAAAKEQMRMRQEAEKRRREEEARRRIDEMRAERMRLAKEREVREQRQREHLARERMERERLEREKRAHMWRARQKELAEQKAREEAAKRAEQQQRLRAEQAKRKQEAPGGTGANFTDEWSGKRFWHKDIPNRALYFGEYLYYAGIVSWEDLIQAINWQRSQRDRIGDIAKQWGWFGEPIVLDVLKERKIGELVGQALIRHEVINPFKLNVLLHHQRKMQKPIGTFFVDKSILTGMDVLKYYNAYTKHNGLYKP